MDTNKIVSIISGLYELDAPMVYPEGENVPYSFQYSFQYHTNHTYAFSLSCQKIFPVWNLRDQLKIGGCKGTEDLFSDSPQGSYSMISHLMQILLRSVLWDYVKLNYDFRGEKAVLKSAKICINHPICMMKIILERGIF